MRAERLRLFVACGVIFRPSSRSPFASRALGATLSLLLGALMIGGLAGCATPIPPTGGPVDDTPPRLARATPADGAVNVSPAEVHLTFSERLNAATVRRALRITPELRTPPEVEVSGNQVTVRFADSLRVETTYVLTLGTDLQDARNVPLARPITMAFATGPTIDRAQISGRVRDPVTGRGLGGLILLAAPIDSAATPPDLRTVTALYQTETNSNGSFVLPYLRPGAFFVAALEDRNRNSLADPGEPFAAPPTSAIRADTDHGAPLDLFVTALDTIPPVPRTARALSDRRITVQFSEPIRLDTLGSAPWSLTDSLSGVTAPLDAVWAPPSAPSEVRLESADALPTTPHQLRLREAGAVRDTSGTPAATFALSVTPRAEPDTLGLRVAAFLPLSDDSVRTLRPQEAPGVRLTRPPRDTLGSSLGLRIADASSGAPVAFTAQTDDGVSFRLILAETPDTLLVTAPDGRTQPYALPQPEDLGGLVGRVSGAEGRRVIVEARAGNGPPARADVQPDGTFSISRLLPGSYHLRLIADYDGDGRWSGGRLAPFTPPEPIRLIPDPVQVRARWDSDVETLAFPDNAAYQTPPPSP